MTLLYLPKHLTWVSHSVLLLFLLLMRFCGCSCYVDNVFLIRHPPTPSWLSRVVAYQSCLSLVCACAKTQIDVYLGKIDIHFPLSLGLGNTNTSYWIFISRGGFTCVTQGGGAGRSSLSSLARFGWLHLEKCARQQGRRQCQWWRGGRCYPRKGVFPTIHNPFVPHGEKPPFFIHCRPALRNLISCSFSSSCNFGNREYFSQSVFLSLSMSLSLSVTGVLCTYL